jgi:amidohydrolase
MSERARAWRRHLHQHPELGFAELETSDFVAATLSGLGGLDVVRGVGGTGVVGSLTRGSSGRAVGLRADMDALALTEIGEHAHRSRHDGRTHACGHDGHMAMLLGAASVLAAEGGFDGTVRFIFQPAEEHGRGARAMLDDGLFDRFPVDVVHGLHNLPGVPAGHLHTRPGPIMAAEDNFEIRITGRGGHAARPHMVVDPLVVAAQIVLALQTIVARNLDAARSAVVSCTGITSDGVRNAIPGRVVITGDTRSFEPGSRELIERRMRELCTGIAAAHGATAEVTYTHEFEPTVNDAPAAEDAVRAAVAVAGAGRVDPNCPPLPASEDFGLLAAAVGGCFTFIGNGTDSAPLHSTDYDFNDDVLVTGIAFSVELVRSLLPG